LTPLDFVIDALATERLTRLVVDDEITADLREWVWKKYPPESTKIGYLLTCPFCASVWAGGLVALASATPSRGVFSGSVAVLKYTLALSGAVSLAREALDRVK
jgi:Protein of unknown function (DUF1360)